MPDCTAAAGTTSEQQSSTLARVLHYVRLEILANSSKLPHDAVAVRIEVPEALRIATISVRDLPAGWDDPVPHDSTREIGTVWARELSTPVLEVPSVIIREDRNYLLNPFHLDFARIRFEQPRPFRFDPRLKSR